MREGVKRGYFEVWDEARNIKSALGRRDRKMMGTEMTSYMPPLLPRDCCIPTATLRFRKPALLLSE